MRKAAVLIALMLSALTLSGADLTGTWSVAVTLDAGTGTATFTFKQTGEVDGTGKMKGTVTYGQLGKGTSAGEKKT